MFKWEMDFFLFQLRSTDKAAIEAVAKVTTTTMLRFSNEKKKKKDNLKLDFRVVWYHHTVIVCKAFPLFLFYSLDFHIYFYARQIIIISRY